MTDPNSENRYADPGPFQKYLFSGACYVRIGQCYGAAKGLLANGKDTKQDLELAEKLESIWNDFLMNQPGTLLDTLPQKPDGSNTKALEELDTLQQEIQDFGREAVADFLGSLDRLRNGELTLNRFFELWAAACDSAYHNLISSDAYAKSLGMFVNALMQFTSDRRTNQD